MGHFLFPVCIEAFTSNQSRLGRSCPQVSSLPPPCWISFRISDILMQQIEAPIVFVRIHGKLVRNRRHEGRIVLTNAVKADFDAAKPEIKHRSNALDALDHARRDGRKKQFGGIEGVWPAVDIGIKPHLCCVFAAGRLPCASVRFATTLYSRSSLSELRYPCNALHLGSHLESSSNAGKAKWSDKSRNNPAGIFGI